MFSSLFNKPISLHSSPLFRPLLAFFLLLSLAACTAPTGIRFVPEAKQPGQSENIFVVTTRKSAGQGDFGIERDALVHYADYSVSIPPVHKVGQIEWPKGEVDPKRHFATHSILPISDAGAFRQKINQALASTPSNTGGPSEEVILFVHGYNTDFSEALYRLAQMHHDFEIDAPTVLFSWPSAGDASLYIYDRDSVKVSRDKLVSLIRLIESTKAKHISLVAHSLGSELLMEALRQIALEDKGVLSEKILSIILIAPDLDIDVFNSQIGTIKQLPDFVIFASQQDKALQISSLLAGDETRVGNNIDETKIKRAGILVLDVSQYGGGSGDSFNHMAAVTSPALVGILKGIAQSTEGDLLRKSGEKVNLADILVDTATLPVTIIAKTTKAVFH